MTIKAVNGSKFSVNWGDGTVTAYTGTGSDQVLSRAYAGASTFICKITGNIKAITKISPDSKFRIPLTGVRKLSDIYYCVLGTPIPTGDLSCMSGLSKLLILQLVGTGAATTNITGALSKLSALTSLTNLVVTSSIVTGDLSNLSGQTSLTNLAISCPLVTGDLSALANKPGLTSLTIASMTATYASTTVLPAWNNTTETLTSIGLSSAAVDQWLIDSNTAGKTGGTIAIAGTNGAHTTASAAALTALQGRGVTVTVN